MREELQYEEEKTELRGNKREGLVRVVRKWEKSGGEIWEEFETSEGRVEGGVRK